MRFVLVGLLLFAISCQAVVTDSSPDAGISVLGEAVNAAGVIGGKKIKVTLTPQQVTLNGCGTVQFTAIVAGGKNKAVTWSIPTSVQDNHSLGSVTATGLYTAPDPRPYTGISLVVRATSVENPSAYGDATVFVNFAIDHVDVVPSAISIPVLGNGSFVSVVYTSCGT